MIRSSSAASARNRWTRGLNLTGPITIEGDNLPGAG